MKQSKSKIIYLSFLAMMALGQLTRVQVGRGLALYWHDFLIIGYLIFSLVKYRTQWQKLAKRLIKNKWFLATIGLIFLSGLINAIIIGFSLTPWLYLGRILAYSLFVIGLSFHDLYSVKKYYKLWMGVGIIIALLGIIQYFFLPDTRFLISLGWDDHYYRLISTQLDPNFTGLILVMTLLLWQQVKTKQKWQSYLVSLVMFLAILLTYSRASYLALLAGSGTLAYIKFSRRKFAKLMTCLLIAVLLSLPFLPQPGGEGTNLLRLFSIESRVENSTQALQVLKPHQWLLGKGVFALSEPETPTTPWNDTAHFPDNLVVFLLVSGGVIGLSLGIYWLYRWGRYLYFRDSFIFSAFMAVMIHSQFNHSLFQPFIWLWLVNLSVLATDGN